MEVTIREAKKDDLDQILKFNYELVKYEKNEFDESLNPAWTQGKVAKNYFLGRIGDPIPGKILDLVPEKLMNSVLGRMMDSFFGRIRDSKSLVILAEMDKVPVGYLCGGHLGNPDYEIDKTIIAQLENMFVLSDYRSNGIGDKLCMRFYEWSKSKDANTLMVKAFKGNELAINFYRKQGFEDHTLTLRKYL